MQREHTAKDIREKLEMAKSQFAHRDNVVINDLHEKLKQKELELEEGKQERGRMNPWITQLLSQSDKADALEVRLTEVPDCLMQSSLGQHHSVLQEQYPSAALAANGSETGSFRLVYNRAEDVPIAEFQEEIGSTQSSQTSVDSWEDLGSMASSGSLASWVSAPARLGAPRCFLPRTCFSLAGGGHITAAQLRSCGGDVVLSPDGSEVTVQQSTKQLAMERDLIQFQMEGSDHPFIVTSDHRIKMALDDGMPTIEEASSLLAVREGGDMRVFHGLESRRVVSILPVRKRTEVVEVTFSDDKTVLAWLPPSRRPRSNQAPSLGRRNAVACRGAPMETRDRMRRDRIQIKNTFLDDTRSSLGPRSLSADALPRTPSWFSVGSLTHRQAGPEQCQVCPTHHRQLLKPSASPCKHGETCRFCHMPHDELAFRVRP